jgi:hypothetical protein
MHTLPVHWTRSILNSNILKFKVPITILNYKNRTRSILNSNFLNFKVPVTILNYKNWTRSILNYNIIKFKVPITILNYKNLTRNILNSNILNLITSVTILKCQCLTGVWPFIFNNVLVLIYSVIIFVFFTYTSLMMATYGTETCRSLLRFTRNTAV